VQEALVDTLCRLGLMPTSRYSTVEDRSAA
jgi:hypothetical protein